MSIDVFKQCAFFVVLCLAQVLVLNHIHLFNCATPLLYVYMVLVFPRNYPKWAELLWSFALGLSIDTFTNTPGMAAAALTFIAAVQPYYFNLFVPQDSPDDLRPSLRNIGVTKFVFYVTSLILLFCLLFFTLESFNFFNFVQWVWCVVGSTVLTTVLVLTIEGVRRQ